MHRAILGAISILFCSALYSQQMKAVVVRTYAVPASRQGVAVDSLHFYVINNSSITKHRKSDGSLEASWSDEDSVIHHLNSGIVLDGKLYVVNSNYPESPMASSLEVFDPGTMRHVDNHSFGILNGSATWLDQYEGFWYVAFAHYTGRGSEAGKDNKWSRLVKFDQQWRQIESWIFPPRMIKDFQTRSNSGGVILDDGRILCTGHDEYILHELRFPKMGYTLEWTDSIPVGSYGQGIAFERDGNAELIYGIIKKNNVVVVSRINPSTSEK